MTEAMDTSTPRETRRLALTEINVDPHVNPRVQPNQRTIEQYCDLYRDGEEDGPALPPLEVFVIDDSFVVVDGHHRLEAALEAGLTHLPCYVSTGTREEAFLRAVEANKANPLPFTYADRDRIVWRLLEDPQTGRLSLRELARMAGVSHEFVRERKKQHEARRSVEAAIRRGIADTSPQVIDLSLSDSDSVVPLSPVEERQALAGLLGLTPQDVLAFERAHGPVKEQLIEEVEDGKSLADAISVVRQDMAQDLTAGPQPQTTPVSYGLLLPASSSPQPQTTLTSYRLLLAPASSPPQPPPEPSATATAWGEHVQAAILRQVLGDAQTPSELGGVHEFLVDALIADPTLLATASPDDVAAALALAIRQTSKTLREWRDWINGVMYTVANLNERSTLAKVQEALTAKRFQAPRQTARAMGRLAVKLQDRLNASAQDRAARRTEEL